MIFMIKENIGFISRIFYYLEKSAYREFSCLQTDGHAVSFHALPLYRYSMIQQNHERNGRRYEVKKDNAYDNFVVIFAE